MSSPSIGGRPMKWLASLRGRLTFANLTAVLALFVALGGSSYAALSVGTDQIANNSVRSKDLRNNDVRGRDIRKGTVRGSDVRNGNLQGKDVRDNTITGADLKESSLRTVPSAQNAQTLAGRPADAYLGTDAQTLGGKPPSAFLGSGEQRRTGLIKLAHGETKTVASSGPFTWQAACSEVGADTRLEVTIESSEADSFAGAFDPSLSQPVSPGAPATVFEAQPPAPGYTIGFPLAAVAPSGAAPLGLAFAGIQVAGADCVVNGILWP
jgi:hypothetical protein